MKNLFSTVFLTAYLTGCSSLMASQFLPSALGGGGIDAEVTVGQKNQEMKNQVGDQAQVINKKEEIPLSFMILLIAGWLAPSPNEIGRGIYILIRGKDNDRK